jgi:hypothetical protein
MDKFNKLLLQLFADGADGGGDGSDNGADNGANGTEPKEEPKAEAKYTDADLDRIINQKFAAWQKQQEKKVSEAERLSKMSAEEKANERIRQLEERIAAADKEKAVAEMTKQARAILSDKNIHVSDALLANLVADDAETTKASVEAFISLFQSAVDKAVKEALKGETPKTGSSSGLTADQIMQIKNRAERQQKIRENMHLFQNK